MAQPQEGGVLYNKYRPRTFDQVVGQNHVLGTFSRELDKGVQSFLLAGPSGVGKTVLARIGAEVTGCTPSSILEVDAASNTGVEDMRKVMAITQYRGFGKSAMRAIIVDECHRLSRQAWESLLKSIEEPPKHVRWFFCTTDPAKVLDTIKTRCTTFFLTAVDDENVERLVESVAKKEGIKLPSGVLDIITRNANGSPRQALNYLSKCRHVKDRAEAVRLMNAAVLTDPTLRLCRFLTEPKGGWRRASEILRAVDDEPETVRYIVVNYMARALEGARSDREAQFFLSILDNFSQPYNPAEKRAPLLLSVGHVLYDNANGD